MQNTDLFATYLSKVKHYSTHSVKAYTKDILQCADFLNQTFEVHKATEVSESMLRSWLAHLLNEQHSANSINRKISALKSFFRFLQQQGKIIHNPTTELKSLKKPKRLPTFIEEKKINEMHASAYEDLPDTYADCRNLLIIELLYATGMRRQELIDLQLSSVQLQKQQIKVVGKRNKERLIPLLPQLLPLISHYLELRKQHLNIIGIKNNMFFVTDKGSQLYPTFVYRLVRKVLTGISTQSKKSPHVLRHSFATHLLNHGAKLNSIKELLGHQSLAATQVYTHNSIEQLKNIYEQAHPRAIRKESL